MSRTTTPRTPRARRRRRALGLAAAAAVLSAWALPSSAVDIYPGLPVTDTDDWTNVAQSGLGYSTVAKQWFRNPVQMGAATSSSSTGPKVYDGPTARVEGQIDFQATVVSPAGAPGTYGYLEPVTVRSVGFGLMPVEATIQVSQRREDGRPIPINGTLHSATNDRQLADGSWEVASEEFTPPVLEDAFNVRILGVKIDGVDIGLTGECRTVTPAPFRLVGPAMKIEYPHNPPPNYQTQWFATHDPHTYYHPFFGGYMKGTITIPAFTGCTTKAGDDLSALMTKSASGPDNPLEVASAWPCGIFVGAAKAPPAPGKNTPKKAGCPGLNMDMLPYPERPAD